MVEEAILHDIIIIMIYNVINILILKILGWPCIQNLDFGSDVVPDSVC